MRAQVEADIGSGRLHVLPATGTDRGQITSTLRTLGVPVIRGAGRLFIDARHGEKLRRAAGAGFQLDWTPEAELMASNRAGITAAWPSLRERVRQLTTGGVTEARRQLGDAVGLDVLDDHQLVNVAAMTLPEALGFCLFDEQGVGKTVTVIYAFDVLVSQNDIDVMVVVAPKSMLSEWSSAFERFMGELYAVSVIDGSRRERQTGFHGGSDVVVLNFEAASTFESELRSLARRCRGRSLLVIDESYFVKNPAAKRTTTLRRLRESFGRAWVLCGTPAPNSPHDIVTQFDLADLGYTFGDVVVPDDREAARAVVRRAMEKRGVYLRSIKSQVLPDLPGKAFTRVFVDFEPLQGVAYAHALDDLIADLRAMDDTTFARQLTSVLARRMALLRICSNPTSLIPGYSAVPAKLDALDAILSDAVGQRHEKIVIWSSFTASLDAIVKRYPQYGPVRFDGRTPGDERGDAIRRFQQDDDSMLFVANPAAAGAGLTLHRARLAVYESLTNQAAHFLQSIDRIHRRGQTREVQYLVLLTRDSIEIPEFDQLLKKESAARDLLGDVWEPATTLEGMLEDLLATRALLPV
jgi:SNF2 family DNA or RNA helicase